MRITIPRQRAVLGGFLVALAAALALIASNSDRSTASASVVVARHLISPGTRLTDADVELRSFPGAAGLASHAFGSVDDLIGANTLAVVGSGELVQQSAIRLGAEQDRPGFAFPIDRDHALAGDLRPGDTVDVLATYGSGLDAETAVLARVAQITAIATSDQASTGDSGRLVVTAAFATEDQVLDVAHASQIASLTLIRSSAGSTSPNRRTIITGPVTPLVTNQPFTSGSPLP
jgi:Flp pilus assembly protein CpaB